MLDISMSGAAVIYTNEVEVTSNRLKVGQVILLILGGKAELPARIVRIFKKGYATKFDFSLDIARL